MTRFPLRVWSGRWAICRLPHNATVPAWAARPAPLVVVARTTTELSIVAAESHVPAEMVCERGFRVIEVIGPVPFSVTGLIASLAAPLADAGISLFPVATHDTDYLLVKDAMLAPAVAALTASGFEVL